MANLSSAEGYITLTGSTESLTAFLKIIPKAQSWGYSTQITDIDLMLEEIEKSTVREMSVKSFFYGYGRWTYDNNIRYLMNWLNNDRDVDGEWQSLWTIEDEINWNQLNEDPITIEFEYNEEESGNQILCESSATLTWDKGKITDPDYTPGEDTMHEYSAENLRNIFEYDEVYDYSDNSIDCIVEDIHDGGWKEYLEDKVETDFDLSKIDDKSSKEHALFIKELKQSFEDTIGESRTLSIWYSVEEWFDSEDVRETLKLTFERI